MARIRILPEQLANKISAGEVVERPAAVVKELVENALDAGARDITIEIEAGGRKMIRVTDDGPGMSREEALLALERHATSKLSTDADLEAITTLGFRGEALPSIASVSRFTLATRVRENVEGTEIYAEGGKIVSVKAHGMAVGTVVEARNLFFNTPARLKFMRSAETEAGHVGDLLIRLAVSRPDIRFAYNCDGRNQFRVAPGELHDRVAALLGTEVSRGVWPLESISDFLSMRGFISRPELSRSSAVSLYTYINGRFIRDRVVQHAVLNAYRGVVERGRYPVLILFIEIPPTEVDVNVHPTKHEVRFRNQGRVHDAIQEAVASVLRAAPWLGTLGKQPDVQLLQGDTPLREERITAVKEALNRYSSTPARQPPQFFHVPIASSSRTFDAPATAASHHEQPSAVEPVGYYSSLTLLGQFNAMYILCQDGTDLVLIDQHAAHERIAFQQLKSQQREGRVETQGLLFPETIELSFSEGACVAEHADKLETLGFDLEPFGGTTFVVKGVPLLVAQADYVRALRDVINDLIQMGKSRTVDDLVDDLLAKMACHSVVRGTKALSNEEIRRLLAGMDRIDFSATCPHGRPVLSRISLRDIEKMFKRSQSGTVR